MIHRAHGNTIKFGVFLFSWILALFLAEALFRIFEFRLDSGKTGNWRAAVLPKEKCLPGVRVQFKPYSNFYTSYDTNPDGYFDSTNRLHYRMNNFGFRGGDYQIEKRVGKYRVMVLGDSFTLGDGVKEEDTFVSKTEDYLRRVRPELEVLNFGTSGWNTADEISYFRYEGVQFQPDLLIVAYVLNDAVYERGPRKLQDKFEEAYKARLFPKSYMFDYVQTAVFRYQLSQEYIQRLKDSVHRQSPNWQKSFQKLAQGKKIAKKNGAEFMVVIFPFLYKLDNSYPFKSLHDHIVAYCKENGIRALDLFEAFEGENHADLWAYPTDHHPNAKAHQITAEALTKYLEQNKLIHRRVEPAKMPQAQKTEPILSART